jgi:thiosulfate/3-mercaptopyruvate sulfurtransferase
MTSLISATDLAARLDDENLRIVDATVHLTFDADGAHVASGRDTYLAGHLPGAVFADQIADLSDPDGEAPFAAADSARFATAIGGLGIGDDSTVVVYDTVNGIWATRLWWQFGLEGFDDVLVLDGGYSAWTAADLPVETGEVTRPAATFTPSRRSERIVSTDEVAAATGDPSVLLVNALDRESFAGGHIPGSVNVPTMSLIDPATHAYLPPEELRSRFANVGALGQDRVITYCGGGIAASSDALVLTLLGAPDVAVYDNSMQEWARDPALPVETG